MKVHSMGQIEVMILSIWSYRLLSFILSRVIIAIYFGILLQPPVNSLRKMINIMQIIGNEFQDC
jgi:predicted PurR-regulated permease PerM